MLGQWQDFNASLTGAEDVIRYAQESMTTVSAMPDTLAELVEQLDVLRVSVF